MQSDVLPAGCVVELPSNPHKGRSARVGVLLNSLMLVLPRSSGMGFLPSSQMYSSLYFGIVLLHRQGLCIGLGEAAVRRCGWVHLQHKMRHAGSYKDYIKMLQKPVGAMRSGRDMQRKWSELPEKNSPAVRSCAL